ncbi:4-diphosphocytidyl-2C-methyl-D-erythritol synthase [Desulfonatronospira thiodismutans ASO3-1]|uniref:4-diphosphocytidyl-2C-methyl-D-erythritol synthase n=1 Tax=Desulfonatronospira thiodismutans ASO3-1 TaxID=555779 RepID=D6SU53_9BACT|nr:phosphocholine cytidylyltransferase family protein [Desulfonatronospira thiodismutans]EFI32833.1 4-diphosphocytidyl-2C-methyl-D-erythritol synthase [Desulfonatronospira thiodismutans ASO3-1]
MKAVILAAGLGSRLGKSLPKCLNHIGSETILSRQMRFFHKHGIKQVIVVVGYKKDLVMEENPEALFKYNPFFSSTNTAKSLLLALENLDEDVIWVNGDVVFDIEVLQEVVCAEYSVAAVDTKKCGPEEIKYTADFQGNLLEISKHVQKPWGEAVGINKVLQKDLAEFRQALKICHNNDYFEKGMEIAINTGVIFKTLDISSHRCIEIDFPQDLIQAQSMFENMTQLESLPRIPYDIKQNKHLHFNADFDFAKKQVAAK